jgi:hypothetical protein
MSPLPPQQRACLHDLGPEHVDPLADREVHHAIHRLCEFADVNPTPRRRRRLVAFSGVASLWAEAALIVAAQSIGLS